MTMMDCCGTKSIRESSILYARSIEQTRSWHGCTYFVTILARLGSAIARPLSHSYGAIAKNYPYP